MAWPQNFFLQVGWYHSPCIFLYIVKDLGSGLLARVRTRVGVRVRVRVRVRIRVRVRVRIKGRKGTNLPAEKNLASRTRIVQLNATRLRGHTYTRSKFT